MVETYASEATRQLRAAALDRKDIAKARASIGNRAAKEEWNKDLLAANDEFTFLDGLLKRSDYKVGKLLRKHELWVPFLSQYKGLGGVHTALLISGIAHPDRFPGQACTKGHINVPGYDVGSQCPDVEWDDDREEIACPGLMLDARTGTGVRSLWHYLGLAVVNGKSPRKRRGKIVDGIYVPGQQNDWNGQLRASILMPEAGIAAQIVKQRTPKYRDIYDAEKARLLERGPLADTQRKKDAPDEVRDGWADHTARKIAAKAFVGDMLTAWKEVLADQEVAAA